jgi:hypothetical protein
MSTAADFEAFWNWNLVTETDMTKYRKALEARFPSDADKRGYFKWTDEQKAQKAAQETTVTPTSRTI